MATRRIAVIPGDGIGPEVVEQALHVIDAALLETGEGLVRWESFPWGSAYYLEHGRMMPVDAIETLRSFDAILLGAVGDPKVPDHVTLNGLLLPIRRSFDQYVNCRPATLFEGVRSPLRRKSPLSIDLVVLRENTEGEYCDVGGRVHRDTMHEVAIQTAIFTRRGTERIIRAAFDLAARRRKRVTSVTKSNAQAHSMVFWDDVFSAVSREFPEIETESLLIDAAVMDLVRRPEDFDVVVASNLFGDVLTDLSATVTGSIGLAASANLSGSRDAPSMFEPVHGSAPGLAGKGIANPIGAILSGKMMLEYLGFRQSAKLIETAVRTTLKRGAALPADLGGAATTREVGAAIAQEIGAS
jgi:tartrate dehydrogenase/decarboxylase/D-malate dehydrogenase